MILVHISQEEARGLLVGILLIFLAPPLLLFVIGFLFRKRNKEISHILYILAVLYLMICFGYFLIGF